MEADSGTPHEWTGDGGKATTLENLQQLAYSTQLPNGVARPYCHPLATCAGVPYGKRHHQPVNCVCEGCSSSGRQLFHEPLFLDCCGLVRKVVRAMQRQLGFRLGPGNQAYQVRRMWQWVVQVVQRVLRVTKRQLCIRSAVTVRATGLITNGPRA